MTVFIELFIILTCVSLYFFAGLYIGIDAGKAKGYRAAKRETQQDDNFTKALRKMMSKAGDKVEKNN